MSTSNKQTGRQVSSNRLSPAMKKYTDTLAGLGTKKASGVFNRLETGDYSPSSPRSIAEFTPDQLAGFDATRNEATKGNPLLGAGIDYATRAAGGEFLGSNPFIDDIVKSRAKEVADQTAQQFAGFGRFASPKHSQMAAQGITSATLPLLAENYENERGRQEQAISMLPMLDQSRYVDPNKQVALGDIYQQFGQAQNDAAYDQQRASLGQKFQQDSALANLILGIGSNADAGSTQTTTQYQPYNAASNILGGVLGFGSLLL